MLGHTFRPAFSNSELGYGARKEEGLRIQLQGRHDVTAGTIREALGCALGAMFAVLTVVGVVVWLRVRQMSRAVADVFAPWQALGITTSSRRNPAQKSAIQGGRKALQVPIWERNCADLRRSPLQRDVHKNITQASLLIFKMILPSPSL